MSYYDRRRIYWDACCKRWRKDIDHGSWDPEEHEHKELMMEDYEVYGNTVAPESDLSGKYILWSPESNLPPRVVFGTKDEAIKAAYSMASKNPGGRFTVAKIEGVAQVQTVKYVDFTTKAKGRK